MRKHHVLFVMLLSTVATAACSGGDSSAPGANDAVTDPGALEPTTAAVPCTASVKTSLPGISVRVKNARCDFTLARAAAGLAIDYEIVVAADLPKLYTQHITGERETKLELLSTLDGQGQRYCLCDTGPGINTVNELGVPAGTYSGSFRWDGKSFTGPSDTGRTKGEAFPAGSYVLTLHGEGAFAKPAQASNFKPDYAIDITIPVVLVD